MGIQQDRGSPSEATTWWSKAILVGALVAVALLPVGAMGARLGLWPFTVGFLMVAGGTLLAAIGLVVGIAGSIAAARRKLPQGRAGVYIATLISALILGLMGLQFYTASSVPAIHDISTDVTDPPQFDHVIALRGEGTNSLEYDGEKVAPLQQQAFPRVKTLETELPPGEALDRAVAVVEDMGLEIVSVDEAEGRVEATATTFWFGFKDDMVVRVLPHPGGGSRVDVRSVSRVGLGDLGANARRVSEFLDAF